MWRIVAVIILPIVLAAVLFTNTGADPSVGQPIEPMRALWLETSANLWTVLRDREHIQVFLDKVKEADFNVIIPEAKNGYGYVIYQSKIAPKINDLDLARLEPFKHPAPNSFLTPDFDILATLIEEAHERQIKVITAVNIFSEGWSVKGIGPAFKHPDWQTTLYVGQRNLLVYSADVKQAEKMKIDGANVLCGEDQLIIYTTDSFDVSPAGLHVVEVKVRDGVVSNINDRLKNNTGPSTVPIDGFLIVASGKKREQLLAKISKGSQISISDLAKTFVSSSESSYLTFVSPHKKEVVDYELAVLRELTENYDIDGIILDRCRYENILADFSVKPTEEWWFKIKHWPGEIITLTPTDTWFTIVRGPYFNQWVGWRARTMKSFIEKARQAVKEIKPDIDFMNYVAAWYPRYWNEGVNWAAVGSCPNYDWVNEEWRWAGTAHLYDYLFVGTYYSQIYGQAWQSVEGGVKLAQIITAGQTELIPSLSIDMYDEEGLLEAVDLIDEMNGGSVMIFDASFIESDNRWEEIREIMRLIK